MWTRLAPNPLADDGLGGMPSRPSTWTGKSPPTNRFQRIVAPRNHHGGGGISAQPARRTDRPAAGPRLLLPLPRRWLPCRRSGAPAPRQSLPRFARPLTMCFASCSQLRARLVHRIPQARRGQPDLVLHLGDYQYEYPAGQHVAPSGNVRDHVGPETVTLANYRQRYAQYKTDPDLQAAHAAAPWLVVFDDHEVADNWAAEMPAKPQPGFLDRRAAALRAYYENMPLRRSACRTASTCSSIAACRGVRWRRSTCSTPASTATTSPAATARVRLSLAEPIPSDRSPARSRSVGCIDGFRRSSSRWDVLGQQVFFSQLDLKRRAGQRLQPRRLGRLRRQPRPRHCRTE